MSETTPLLTAQQAEAPVIGRGFLHFGLAAVIMCTNRLGALDPAVRRRAADVLIF